MYITIPVLVCRHFGEVESKEAGVAAGKKKTPEEIEFELEKLLAPYDYATTLNISCGRGPREVERTVPNYGAQFDFWDIHERFFEVFKEEFAEVEVECRIYPAEGIPGYEVIAARDLPLNIAYNALVTPDGQYHEFPCSEPSDEATARLEELISDHSECLAVICKAHI